MTEITLDDFKKISGAVFVGFDRLQKKNIRFIENINTDTRSIKSGEVFWALSGDNFDGHDYLNTAFEKQALFCVAQADKFRQTVKGDKPALLVPDTLKALQELARIHRRKFKFPVIALTGSNGKTTTKEMLAHILGQKLNVHKTAGNLNNHIGCPLTLLQLTGKQQAAVIELGTNHPGEIAVLRDITEADHRLITNVGGAHLGYFESDQAIADEKRSLFENFSQDGWIYKNLDDPFTGMFDTPAWKTVSYSFEKDADIRASFLGLDENGNGAFRLNDKADIKLKVAGMPNVKNALAAAAVALNMGFGENEIRDGLESFAAFDKRMEVFVRDEITIINDSYNANPVSMKVAFETVDAMQPAGRIFLVLGDMFELGRKSAALHAETLRLGLQLRPAACFLMGEHMLEATGNLSANDRHTFFHKEDHASLAADLKTRLKKGDLILIKGSRGMQMENVIDYLF